MACNQLGITDMENIKVKCKSTQLISILNEHLSKNINLARIKFFGLLICALRNDGEGEGISGNSAIKTYNSAIIIAELYVFAF